MTNWKIKHGIKQEVTADYRLDVWKSNYALGFKAIIRSSLTLKSQTTCSTLGLYQAKQLRFYWKHPWYTYTSVSICFGWSGLFLRLCGSRLGLIDIFLTLLIASLHLYAICLVSSFLEHVVLWSHVIAHLKIDIKKKQKTPVGSMTDRQWQQHPSECVCLVRCRKVSSWCLTEGEPYQFSPCIRLPPSNSCPKQLPNKMSHATLQYETPKLW